MTNLTDKWKKGELPSGYYYIKNEFGNIFPSDYSENYDCISDTVIKDFFTEVSEIKEVLEPVPSYEEYTKLKEELKDYEYQHKQDGICYDDMFCKLELARKENRQLKELLKECRDEIDYLRKHYKGNIDHFKNNTRLDKELNRALGEDKWH